MTNAVTDAMTAPDIRFRPATAADALCIAVLGMQVYLDTYATEGIRPALAREVLESFSPDCFAAAIARPNERFLLCESAAHLIGFAQWAGGQPHALAPATDAAELKRLYVQQRFTGRGVGRALLAGAESAAFASGASTVWLTAWIGNARALRFYPACGYAERGSTLFEAQGERHENRLFAKDRSAGASLP